MSSTLVHHKGDIHVQVAKFIAELKRRQITGSKRVGSHCAQLLLRYISASKWIKVSDLINDVRKLGKNLIQAQPREFVIGNVVRRVLGIIREVENDSEITNQSQLDSVLDFSTSSMFGLLSLDTSSKTNNESKSHMKDAKAEIIESIQELIDEIQNIDDSIAGISVDLIHENEVLLTPSPNSKTVLEFLLRASQKRKFTVLVSEGFPNEITASHEFALKLAKAGIHAVIIPDTAISAVMSRVGKVIIGTRSVLANGGCISSSGVTLVCECAKDYRVPVLAVSGLYKVSPLYPYDIDSLIEIGDSGKVIGFNDSELMDKVEVMNPVYDYIKPENIDIYITNIGSFSPSFTYRIILDHYSNQDVNL